MYTCTNTIAYKYFLYIMSVLQPLDNDFVKSLELPSGYVVFHWTCVDQLKQARSSIFDQIEKHSYRITLTFDLIISETKEKFAT